MTFYVQGTILSILYTKKRMLKKRQCKKDKKENVKKKLFILYLKLTHFKSANLNKNFKKINRYGEHYGGVLENYT